MGESAESVFRRMPIAFHKKLHLGFFWLGQTVQNSSPKGPFVLLGAFRPLFYLLVRFRSGFGDLIFKAFRFGIVVCWGSETLGFIDTTVLRA